ncbi:hypothetical protein [Cohnella fermenti]|uniref:Uncharacterized protein n=1 Tax=Cohnella fermenti TaxID=2565925 RepID=A0A4S4BS25_9BACL|nr:hypothetical protein [Cohnella fermenti]THF77821.1 hypothetical protein E6C55_15915 [Cohnella fermenti]
MGQYLQLGICYQMLIQKREIAGGPIEQVNREVGKFVDLNLFNVEETDEHISFSIKEKLIEEQLYKFLEEQFALYEGGYQEEFSTVLSEISKRQSFDRIVELAKEKRHYFFQQSDVYDYIKITPWRPVRMKTSLLAILIEGKLAMESYNSYLRYMEKLVRSSSKQTIAGAFRACID